MSARKSAGFGRFINLFLLYSILIKYTITPPRTGMKVEALFRASWRVPGAPCRHWQFCIGDYNGHHPP